MENWAKYEQAVQTAVREKVAEFGLGLISDSGDGKDPTSTSSFRHHYGTAWVSVRMGYQGAKDISGLLEHIKEYREPISKQLLNKETTAIVVKYMRDYGKGGFNKDSPDYVYTYKDNTGTTHSVTAYQLSKNYGQALKEIAYDALFKALGIKLPKDSLSK